MKKINGETAHNDWVLYLLTCRGGRLYTGITNDLNNRLKAHEQGKGSKFVRAFSPFELAAIIPCKNGTEARKLECKIKKLRRSEKLELVKSSEKRMSRKKRNIK